MFNTIQELSVVNATISAVIRNVVGACFALAYQMQIIDIKHSKIDIQLGDLSQN